MELIGSKIGKMHDDIRCLLEKFTSGFNMFTNKYMNEEMKLTHYLEKKNQKKNHGVMSKKEYK